MYNLKNRDIKRICERFNKELKNWSYESWLSSSFSERDEIAQSVLNDEDFSMFTEEELYEVFDDWASGVDKTYFD